MKIVEPTLFSAWEFRPEDQSVYNPWENNKNKEQKTIKE